MTIYKGVGNVLIQISIFFMKKLPREVVEFFKQKGSKGGKATAKKHGTNYYSLIAKKRWEKKKKLSTI